MIWTNISGGGRYLAKKRTRLLPITCFKSRCPEVGWRASFSPEYKMVYLYGNIYQYCFTFGYFHK